MRASESSTSRIWPRVLSNSGDSMNAFFVIAFCACTQSIDFAPWMSSSHRYGSSVAALVAGALDAEGGFANAMPAIVTPNAKTVQMVFMTAVPAGGQPWSVARACAGARVTKVMQRNEKPRIERGFSSNKISRGSVHREQRDDQQRDDVDDLDQRVHGRTRGVLVRIAHGVAGDRGFVRLGTLAAEVAVFDVLLGVVPGAAAGGHRDGHEQAGDDGADQDTAQRLRTQDQPDQDRHDDRQQRRDDHFLDRGPGQHVHRAVVLRLAGALHDALDLAELAPDFLDHRTRRAT